MQTAFDRTPQLLRVRDLLWAGTNDRALRRAAERGLVVRLIPGVYVDSAIWRALDGVDRYLLRIAAVNGTRRGASVISHHSAAALLGLPVIGAWPEQVHLIVGAESGQRSSPGIVRHVVAVRSDELLEWNGFLMTNPLRTVCDVARTSTLDTAVAALDRVLAPSGSTNQDSGPLERVFGAVAAESARSPQLGRSDVLEALHRLGPARGVRRGRFAAEFADGRSGSPGESLSRLQIHRLRLPRPDLQVRVPNGRSRYWEVDFGWEEFALFGEFDGFGKYRREEMTRGRRPEDIVVDEKIREDAIRARTGRRLVRWSWEVARSLPALQRRLREGGLRPVGR